MVGRLAAIVSLGRRWARCPTRQPVSGWSKIGSGVEDMTLTLNLPPDLESRLQNEAERQGLPVVTLTLQLLDQHLPSKNPQEELARLLQSWIVEGDAQEQRETGEYLVRSLDEDRLSDRSLFPAELKGVTW